MSTREIRLNMSASQSSEIGNFLYRGYYGGGQLRDLIDVAPNRSGYPHNGGEHTLHMRGTVQDLTTWLEMFEGLTNLDLSILKQEVATAEHGVVAHSILPSLFHYQG